MPFVLRFLAVLIGFVLIAAVVRSCCRVALVNTRTIDGVAKASAQGIYGFMRLLLRRHASYPDCQKILAWFAPCFLLTCIACYFIFTTAGFGLIYWGVSAEETIFRAMIASGSALSTLGFCTPSTPRGEIIAVAEGAVGLGIVVFLITFVPGYQSAIQRREEISAELYAHTNGNPSCETVLLAYSGNNALPAPLRDWEFFLRELGDIHATSPILIFTPSIRRGQSWVVSTYALLHAVNFIATTSEDSYRDEALICLHEGELSLQRMVTMLRVEKESLPNHHPSRREFDALWDRLKAMNPPLTKDRERAWADFASAEARYAPYCRIMAKRLFVPLHNSLTSQKAEKLS